MAELVTCPKCKARQGGCDYCHGHGCIPMEWVESYLRTEAWSKGLANIKRNKLDAKPE